jgi:hypothetical protein
MEFAAAEPIMNCGKGQERRKTSNATAPIQISAFAIQRARLKPKRSASTAKQMIHAAKAMIAAVVLVIVERMPTPTNGSASPQNPQMK